MKLSRDLTGTLRFFFDEFTPPILRDSRWFMYIPFVILFGKKRDLFFNFKSQVTNMTDEEFANVYRELKTVSIQRNSDLNEACFNKILSSVLGNTVLEVGCGNAFLASALSKKSEVSAVDIVIDPDLRSAHPSIRFQEANIESLPFADNSFDTVVCTHTLEHVRDFHKAVQELRRVTTKRLIIVVPQQRPYKYTFDLHIHFFPYPSSLRSVMGGKKTICESLDGDLYYVEDF